MNQRMIILTGNLAGQVFLCEKSVAGAGDSNHIFTAGDTILMMPILI